MMAKKTPPTEEDQDQSRRFFETAKALADAGELNPTEGEAAFARLLDKTLTPKKRSPAK